MLGEDHSLKNREMHILYSDTIKSQYDTVKPGNDTINDTVNDTVFHLIKENNKITANEISEKLNVSLSTVRRRIKALKESGLIERVGSNKTGYWRVKCFNK